MIEKTLNKINSHETQFIKSKVYSRENIEDNYFKWNTIQLQ